jgi:hypothetical protein
MAIGRAITAALLAFMCAGWAQAQGTAGPSAQASVTASASALTHRPSPAPAASETISLTVPKGTPVHVILDHEVRVKKVGQAIQGRVAEPVYAFDKLVIPAGAKVNGQITQIERVSGGKRTAAALDANFSPVRKVQVEFDELDLPNGKGISIHTIVTRDSGKTIQFVATPEEKKGVRDTAAERTREAKQQVKQEWGSVLKEARDPGKIHRLEHFAVEELPVHPQYIEAGTAYFAELQEPLDFGSEPFTPQMASSIGATPPDGSVVEARLVTPLSSETAHSGDAVEAMISRPLFEGDRLILPQGSVLRGSVIQAHPAHHLARNGELRIVFHELRLADGVERKVEASLAGVEAAKAGDVKLDSEGGAHATSPGTRFLTTGLSVGLGGFSMIGDSGGGDLAHREAGTTGGYKLIGIALGVAIHSQPFGMAMGAFGASRSIYANFIARGREVVFPKNTAMAISIATRPRAAASAGEPSDQESAARQ